MPNTQITHQHYAIHTNIINYTNITVLHSPHRVLQPNNYSKSTKNGINYTLHNSLNTNNPSVQTNLGCTYTHKSTTKSFINIPIFTVQHEENHTQLPSKSKQPANHIPSATITGNSPHPTTNKHSLEQYRTNYYNISLTQTSIGQTIMYKQLPRLLVTNPTFNHNQLHKSLPRTKPLITTHTRQRPTHITNIKFYKSFNNQIYILSNTLVHFAHPRVRLTSTTKLKRITRVNQTNTSNTQPTNSLAAASTPHEIFVTGIFPKLQIYLDTIAYNKLTNKSQTVVANTRPFNITLRTTHNNHYKKAAHNNYPNGYNQLHIIYPTTTYPNNHTYKVINNNTQNKPYIIKKI
eukprot:gene2661-1659_t